MNTELKAFQGHLHSTTSDVVALRKATINIGYLVSIGSGVLTVYETINKTADQTTFGTKVLKAGLFVVGFVAPLKTPTKVLGRALDKLAKPVEKIDKKLDQIDGKDDTKTPGKESDGAFVKKINEGLKDTSVAINAVRDAETLTIWRLETASDAMAQFETAMRVALRSGEQWSGKYDALNSAIEAQLGARNVVADNIADFFSGVKPKVDRFLEILNVIDFEEIENAVIDMADINKLFEFLEKPLALAQTALEPVLELLNAISSAISLIVDPIIDYVVETLGLDDLFEAVEEQINKLLPALDLFDAFFDLMQDLQDAIVEYLDDFMDSIEYLDLIESTLFGNVVGEADQGPTGWDYDFINLLEGDDGDDILAGLDGRDTIRGEGGNDVIIGGTGSDSLDGGAGDDLFYFDASFTEFELSRDPDTDNIIVNHLRPSDPEMSLGIDTLGALDDEDNVVFTDISFTGKELNEAILGNSILNGNSQDNLMFLSSIQQDPEVPILKVDGFHVANGFGGDDRIFGTVEADRLNGGSGNDVLLPGLGDDEVNGNNGSDTFQVLSGANTGLRVDLLDGTAFGQGHDTLNSIENVIVSPDREHRIQADAADNYISTGDELDVISGRGGDDTIESGGEDDLIVAGAGADSVFAGAGRDIVIAGSVAVAGVVDYYDGGSGDFVTRNAGTINERIEDRGFDVLTYTSESNTVRFEIRNDSSVQEYWQRLKDYMEDAPTSGPVRIEAGSDEVQRFDAQGNLITTDIAVNFEGFSGSDANDTIIGDPTVRYLHGAGGNDTIETGGSATIHGGQGDDTILAELVDDGATQLFIEGDGGFDVLDLRSIEDARWYYKLEGSIALTLKAFEATREGRNLQNEGNAILSIKPKDIQEIQFGDFADHVNFRPGGGQLTQLFLNGGDDFAQILDGNVEVFGGDGDDDILVQTEGIIRGEGGNDRVQMNASGDAHQALMGDGNDFLEVARMEGHADGGDGYDSISFTPGANSRMVIDAVAGTAVSFKGIASSFDRVDITIENFEEYILTAFNDFILGADGDEQILGNDGNDTIRSGGGRDQVFGGSGNDSIEAGDGDDLLHGGIGNDTLDGNGGRDAVSYAWVRPGGEEGDLFAGNFSFVTVNLGTGIATGAFGTDRLRNIENVFGSGGNDNLFGDAFDNVLSGEDGNDGLEGNAGNDVLITGAGVDYAFGGTGNDTVVIGTGTKTLLGGTGFDVLDFGTVSGSVIVDFGAGTYTGAFNVQAPRWAKLDFDGDGVNDSDGTEARLFNGILYTPQQVLEADPNYSNSNDDLSRVLPDEDDDAFELFGIELIDVPDGGSSGIFGGFESVIGGESGATIILTSGIDRFDGRISDNDMIDLSNSGQAITYSLKTGANNVALLAGDEVSGIEGIAGAGFDDRLTGDNGRNMLSGRAGDDRLKGQGGDDDLSGEGGDDDLRGGKGDDSANGGNDNDTVAGDEGHDTLLGGAGHDLVLGGAGNDRILGGSGDDTLAPGDGVNTIDGGSGADMIKLESSAALYLISDNLRIAGVSNVIRNIEHAEGSEQADTLAGDTGANYLDGAGGNDRLSSRGGDDTLLGGSGNDSLSGSTGNESLEGGNGRDTVSAGSGADTVKGGKASDVIDGGNGDDLLQGGDGNDALSGGKGHDTLKGGKGQDTLEGDDGNDSLNAGDGDDRLDGGAGNDTLNPGRGQDTVDGGAGLDLLVLTEATTLNLATGNAQMGGSAKVISNIENVLGSDEDDALTGDNADNRLEGADGDDTILSGKGADTVLGGDGKDDLRGSSGAQTFAGGKGNDTIAAGKGKDSVEGGDGADQIFGEDHDDLLTGGKGNDSIEGETGDDHLEGGSGRDMLDGGRGADRLLGDDGNDLLLGGRGEDTLTGGTGNDTLSGGANADVFVFAQGDGKDQVTDFEDGRDQLDVSEHGLSSASQVRALATDLATGTRIDFGSGDTVFLEGIFKADLTNGDFIFS